MEIPYEVYTRFRADMGSTIKLRDPVGGICEFKLYFGANTCRIWESVRALAVKYNLEEDQLVHFYHFIRNKFNVKLTDKSMNEIDYGVGTSQRQTQRNENPAAGKDCVCHNGGEERVGVEMDEPGVTVHIEEDCMYVEVEEDHGIEDDGLMGSVPRFPNADKDPPVVEFDLVMTASAISGRQTVVSTHYVSLYSMFGYLLFH